VPCWKNKKQPNMGLDNQLYVKKKKKEEGNSSINRWM
jgi:hypothetical protein